MRPRDRDDLRFVLALVRFPQERVGVLDAPLAGGLPGLDVEVQMRPAAAAPLLAEHADLLPRLDASPRLHALVDRFQVGVTDVPAVRVEDVDVVVIATRLVERGVAVFGTRLAARRNDQPVARRDHVHHPLAAADVIAGVVVDGAFQRGQVAAIDVGRLVADLRRAGEPALPGRVDERARFHPGGLGRPQPQPRVLVEAPGVLERVVIRVKALGRGAIDLHAPDRNGQPVVARGEGGRAAIDFDGHVRAAKGLAQRVARLLDFEQLDRRLAAVGEPHLNRFAAIEIDGRKERLLILVATDQNRGDKECEVHGVGFPVWRRCSGIRLRSGHAAGQRLADGMGCIATPCQEPCNPFSWVSDATYWRTRTRFLATEPCNASGRSTHWGGHAFFASRNFLPRSDSTVA